MKGLLDTHTFIWWDGEPSKLSPAALTFLQDPANTLLLSVVSVWEILLKMDLGKLTLRLPLRTILGQQQASGVQFLDAKFDHVLALETLPKAHKDPFDRLLAAQAIIENLVLLTADPVFAHYPVQILW